MSALTSDNLERLSAMGLSMEQIIEVARMFERQRSPNAIRQARYREAHKDDAQCNVTSDVTSNATDNVTAPLSPSPPPPDPPHPAPIPVKNIYTRETPKPPPKGCRLKTDWTPTETDLAFAAEQGLSPQEASREADKFRDYWCARSGRDATKLDWSRTWANWVRTSVDRRRGPAAPRQPSSGNRPEARSMAEIITRRRREEADGEPIPR